MLFLDFLACGGFVSGGVGREWGVGALEAGGRRGARKSRIGGGMFGGSVRRGIVAL